MREHIIALADTENGQKARANDRRPFAQHAGLVLQRFFADTMLDGNTRQRRNKRDPQETPALLQAAIAAAQDRSVREIYADAFARWTSSFPRDRVQSSEPLSTTGRLAVGLGAQSVLETGLRLHHTYGVPIIPGSALKGLASHYCHDIWGQRSNEEASEETRLFRRGAAYHSMLFGTTDDGGAILFEDAWILPKSLEGGALRLDVMTPHHPKWQTNEAPPTDFDSPVPVWFLSVTGTFDFRLSWAGPAGVEVGQATAWTRLAMGLLREALAEWGIGAKTSSGYGRLSPRELSGSDKHPAAPSRPKPAALPSAGTMVEAKLLEGRTKKGGWKALHEPSGLGGAIQNSNEVPADRKVGDTLKLIVASANATELAFRFPTHADEQRVHRGSSKGKERGRLGRSWRS